MITAIYLRKSRAEELSDTVDETLKRHRETLQEFAAKNNLDITKIYEEVVSGESLYARPQMLQLLTDVERGEYDAVLCMDIDRLGRGAMSDQGVILETLKNADTKIITPRKIYDLNNEMDETYSEFETFMARQELKAIKRRMQRGIKKTIADGGYVANAPYGYVKTTVNKRPTLAVCEEEARFVRMMFDLYVNKGLGCQHIADTVNAMGAKPHRSEKFGRSSVMKILHNPVYTGKIVWNRKTQIRKGAKGNSKQITIQNSPDRWTVVAGIHPPIVQDEIFEQAQKMAACRSHPPANTGSVENPLAGLVYCAHCGAPMQRQVIRKGGAYLLCQKPGCMVSSALSLIEDAVVHELKSRMSEYRISQKNPALRPKSENREFLNTVESEIKTTAGQIGKLHDLLEQGVYDLDTFLKRQTYLKEKENRLQKMKDTTTSSLPIDCPNDSKKAVTLLEVYGAASTQKKNLLLKAMIGKIIYNKEKGAKPGEFTLEVYLKPIHS
ncbi:recombinase family protein [Caproiciproducens faecalis]|uniref:Recombinase family protein n=1 Tax=Caproiciproducens faecalis TaxID=2820301 RepID=A0ABS7DPR7_9FIRM|nr:recombinase family protein [Caproiciproducens faecalis]MBW7573298.1 recombinase family protein [Caproiciproducens faecalis]